jgi:hypothetical protein
MSSKDINYHIQNYIKSLSSTNNEINDNLDKYGVVEEYDNRYVKPFIKNFDTLAIKSQKGTGKTKAMMDYIKENNPEYCLFITFRTSLSRELQKRLNGQGFIHYQDIEGKITMEHKRIIIQAESLIRIRWNKINLLVLDEINSLESQMFSKITMKDKMSTNINKFISLVKESEKVILMDADLNEKQLLNISRIRQKPLNIIVNKHKSKSESELNLYLEEQNLIDDLIENAKSKNIVVGITRSIIFSEAIERKIKNAYPDKKILLINSKTSKTKHIQSIIKNVECDKLGFQNYDVVIYTPTIQAGVSFNKKHFHKFYGFFSNHMKVNATRQMIDRIRCFENNQFNYHIKYNHPENIPLDKNEFEEFIRRRRNFDNSEIEIPAIIPFREQLNGNINYPLKDEIYEMWINDEIEKANDKYNFTFKFLKEEYNTGIRNINIVNKTINESEIEDFDGDNSFNTQNNSRRTMIIGKGEDGKIYAIDSETGKILGVK